MITEMRMPKMGQTMEEGALLSWEKSEGQAVSAGEVLCAIMSDKARVEIEAAGSGILRKIIVGENETVPVGALIAIIADPDEDISESLSQIARKEEIDYAARKI